MIIFLFTIVLILISVCLYGISLLIKSVENIETKIKEITPSLLNERSFNSGVESLNVLVRCALFKMWKDDELLDFNNMDNKLAESMNFLYQNNGNFTNIRDELVKYLEIQSKQEEELF
jgi:hypothetical protein